MFLQEQGWLCLSHGCCREMADVTVLIMQWWICRFAPPLLFFFLSEKVEDNSWEGVEE